jgi:hypothetical protein
MTNASLMAPPDMARFALAYCAPAIVPGYALATGLLVQPGRGRKPAFSPALG